MSERKLLLLMTAEQTEAFTRGSDDGALWRGCRVPAGGHVPGGARRPEPPPRWRRIHDAPTSTISRRDRLGRIPKDGDRPLVADSTRTAVPALPWPRATTSTLLPIAAVVGGKTTHTCLWRFSCPLSGSLCNPPFAELIEQRALRHKRSLPDICRQSRSSGAE